jgi:cytoplasmic tRNA 2-thiolation protein 1
MLAIDEGIKGYRDDSLEAVKRNQKIEQMPLEILSYKELYGWTMDEIVKVIGQTNNCTYCGVFRRQALERGAVKLGCCKVVTGHNADDIAETVLMNMLRGDLNRLGICANAISGEEDDPLSLPRVKPLKYAYEKEIVLYAYHKKLDYFSTECIYSPFAYRGHVRELIKQMECTRPQAILDVIYSAESIRIN